MTCFTINKKTLRQWSIENNISYGRIYYWLEKGLSVEEAVEKAKEQKKFGRPSKFQYNGESLMDYCKLEDISYSSVYRLIKNGMDVGNAINKVLYSKIKPKRINFEIGDMVEFWVPNKKYRYGKVVRKEDDICIVVSNMLKRRRIYKVKEENLNYYRGESYVQCKYR